MIVSPLLAGGPILSVPYITGWPMNTSPCLAGGSIILVPYITGWPMNTGPCLAGGPIILDLCITSWPIFDPIHYQLVQEHCPVLVCTLPVGP